MPRHTSPLPGAPSLSTPCWGQSPTTPQHLSPSFARGHGVKEIQPASETSPACQPSPAPKPFLAPQLWLGKSPVLGPPHPSWPSSLQEYNPPHSGHSSSRTWPFQAMGKRKCLPKSLRRPQPSCTNRSGDPLQVRQGTGITLESQSTVIGTGATKPGPRATLPSFRRQGGPTPHL